MKRAPLTPEEVEGFYSSGNVLDFDSYTHDVLKELEARDRVWDVIALLVKEGHESPEGAFIIRMDFIRLLYSMGL